MACALVEERAPPSSPPPTTPPPAANTTSFTINAAPDQIHPAPGTSASASASFVIDTTAGGASGDVTLTGVNATAVTINGAYAGNSGPVVLSLTQSASNSNVWSLASGASLDAAQRADLLAGKLYVLVASSAYPSGELRGQLVPSDITVVFAPASGEQQSPAVTTAASGVAAVTLNRTAKTAAVNVNTTGADTATAAEVLASFVGSSSLLAVLTADNSRPGHWLNENISLSDADLANFNSSRWYVNVYTPAHPGGELRGQIAAANATLTSVQDNVFTSFCSACHTGVGSALPGVQNLTTAANSFAAAVNVASLEQSSLLRVKPFDPDNSYLVRKVEGHASITGSSMPPTGPLPQTQIDLIRAWVAAGAQNN